MSSPRRFVRQPGGTRVSTIVPGCANAGPCGGSPGPFPDSISASFGSPLGACAGCSSIGTITLTHSPGDCLSYVGTFSNGCDTYSVLLSYTATSSNPAQHWVLNIQAPSPASCASSGFAAWEATANTFAGTIGLQNTGTGTDGCCNWPLTIFIDVPDCVGGSGKPCCCGGNVEGKPCFYVCIEDPDCGGVGYDVRVCRDGDNSYSGSDPLSGISVTMTYSAASGYTVSYTCSGAGGHSHTFSTWGKSGGFMLLSYQDPAGWSISATSGGPLCAASGPQPCSECANSQMAKEYLVEIGPGWGPNPAGDTNCASSKETWICDGPPCPNSTIGGVPGSYFMTIPTRYLGFCAVQGPQVPETGCCSGPQGANCGFSVLYFGKDGGGYFIGFDMLGGIIGQAGCDMTNSCVWGRWKLYVGDQPPDCLSIAGLSLPYVGPAPGDGICGCVTSSASCMVTAL